MIYAWGHEQVLLLEQLVDHYQEIELSKQSNRYRIEHDGELLGKNTDLKTAIEEAHAKLVVIREAKIAAEFAAQRSKY